MNMRNINVITALSVPGKTVSDCSGTLNLAT